MTAATDDGCDLEEWADRPAVPEGAWFSLSGTGDPAALSPEAFAQGGPADQMEPGAVLAALAEGMLDPAGLALVSDNALLGVVGASQRLMSRAAAMTQRAVAEYARRQRQQAGRGRVSRSRAGYAEFSPDDLAPELAVNPGQAEAAMLRHELAQRRLPGCCQALWDGTIGDYPMRIIADATVCLDDAGAAEADQILAQAAPGLTPGQLRALAARVVLMIDPDAAERRRRDAAAQARVSHFREDAGTAGLSGRDLPPDAVLRSWQHIDTAARALAAAGIKAGLDKLRAAVYLGLTSGTDPLTVLPLLQDNPGECFTPEPPAQPGTPHRTGRASGAQDDSRAGDAGDHRETDEDRQADDRQAGHHGEVYDGGQPYGDDDNGDREADDGGEDGSGEGGARRDGPGPSGPSGSSGPSGPVAGPVAPFPAVINLLVPVGTLFGWSSAPGEIPGWGPLDPETTVQMTAAASRHPSTRWCITLTDPRDGTAVAHGCAPGRHPWVPPGGAGPGPHGKGGTAAQQQAGRQSAEEAAGQRQTGEEEAELRRQAAEFLASLRVGLARVARDACDHAECTDRYQVPRKLKHLIRARTATCIAPCCNRAAADGDADHAIPWPDGPTCQANLGGACRRHHRNKQAPGWALTQPRPGTFQWVGPSGRVRVTYPTRYLL
jgi:hypothetical protein